MPKLNETCLSLQWKETNIFRAQDNMLSLSLSFQCGTLEVEHHDNDRFQLTVFLRESETELVTETHDEIKDLLNSLSDSLTEYLPSLEYKNHYWV